MRDEDRRWRVAIGPGFAVEPEFPGADGFTVLPMPAVDIDWGGLLFVNNRDGVGFNPVHTPSLRLAFALTVDRGRDDDDAARLRGLGDIDPTIEFGGLLEWTVVEHVILGLRARQDIFGEHQGLLLSAEASYSTRPTAALGLRVGVSTTWASDDYMDSFFGVNAAQAAASGLPFFRADAGIRDVAGDAELVWDVTRHWFVRAYARLGVLVGDAADSPVTETSTQAAGQLGFGYRF